MKRSFFRSPIMYYGGKGNMISKLLRIVPAGGSPYCEPYCGGASLFFARAPAPVEVLNDLDGDLVNMFRCLQDKELFEDLRHRLVHTLYSRAEFARALEVLEKGGDDIVSKAWAFFVAKNQSVSGLSKRVGNWSRVFVGSGNIAYTTNRWIMRLSMLDDFHKRLLRAQIDNRDALEVIRYWDNPNAVFYIDPPYHHATRSVGQTNVYVEEADHEHHKRLVSVLLACKGAVVLSGYDHPVYDALVRCGWRKIQISTACHAAVRGRSSGLIGAGAARAKVPRIETIWTNKRAESLMVIGAPSRQRLVWNVPLLVNPEETR